MRISELIAALTALQAELGDLDVVIFHDETCDYYPLTDTGIVESRFRRSVPGDDAIVLEANG